MRPSIFQQLLFVQATRVESQSWIASGDPEHARVVPDMVILEVAFDPVECEVVSRERGLNNEDWI